MALNDSITALANATVTVTRTATGVHVDGIYVPGATSTFEIVAVIQPAYNLNRVIGGADLHATLTGQAVESVYQVHTVTELKTRTPTTDPDTLVYRDATWTVTRVECWELGSETHYHCVISKQAQGAS